MYESSAEEKVPVLLVLLQAMSVDNDQTFMQVMVINLYVHERITYTTMICTFE